MKIEKLFVGNTDNTFIQFFRYCFVGGFAFIADIGVLVVLAETFGANKILASAIAFLAGLAVNYLLSTYWIFKHSIVKNKFAEFFAFAVIGAIGLCINAAVIWFFDTVLAQGNSLGNIITKDKYYLIGKVISTVVVFLWNFFARKIFLFGRK